MWHDGATPEASLRPAMVGCAFHSSPSKTCSPGTVGQAVAKDGEQPHEPPGRGCVLRQVVLRHTTMRTPSSVMSEDSSAVLEACSDEDDN